MKTCFNYKNYKFTLCIVLVFILFVGVWGKAYGQQYPCNNRQAPQCTHPIQPLPACPVGYSCLFDLVSGACDCAPVCGITATTEPMCPKGGGCSLPAVCQWGWSTTHSRCICGCWQPGLAPLGPNNQCAPTNPTNPGGSGGTGVNAPIEPDPNNPQTPPSGGDLPPIEPDPNNPQTPPSGGDLPPIDPAP